MKLLAKSTRYYLLFATVIMLVAIPIFYFMIQRIVLEDLDESLVAEKRNVLNHLHGAASENSAPFNSAVEILPVAPASLLPPDTLYTQTLYDSFSKEHIPYRVLQTYIRSDGHTSLIRMKRSLIDEQDLIESIITVVILLLLLIILGMILINRFQSRKIWSPFYRALQQLKDFEIEKSSTINLPVTRIDEFNDLHRSIRLLTDKSREAYQSQKAFTENASHEMQTPLAVMAGKLELLMQTQPISAEQAALITDLEDAGRRMSHLNKSLLLLTRIENHQYYEKQPLSINEALMRITGLYTSRAEHMSLQVKLHLSDQVRLTANAALMDILLGNLIGNAIRHNIPGGLVIIDVGDGRVCISNTGKKVPLDIANFVKRFQKDSTDKDSLGLGLSICHKICEINDYQFIYTFSDDLHSFTLKFPR